MRQKKQLLKITLRTHGTGGELATLYGAPSSRMNAFPFNFIYLRENNFTAVSRFHECYRILCSYDTTVVKSSERGLRCGLQSGQSGLQSGLVIWITIWIARELRPLWIAIRIVIWVARAGEIKRSLKSFVEISSRLKFL